MAELRRLPAEGVVQFDMLRGGNKPFLLDGSVFASRQEERSTYSAPNDMSDLHVFVVDNIGKVIGREPVRLDDNIIILGLGFPKLAIDNVVNVGGSLGAAETHNKGLPFARTLF